MSGHGSCCKDRTPPKTRAAFAALNYPTNPSGHADVNNRLHNPEKVPVIYEKAAHATMRKGWWFRLNPAYPGPPLLDGTGDGKARGLAVSCNGITPKIAGDRLVCLNAANLKTMPVPGEAKPRMCGFTWNVKLQGQSGSASGWMPLKALTFQKKNSRATMMAALRSNSCCVKKYATWGRSLTLSKSTPYAFRTVAELEAELAALVTNKKKFATYFREKKPGSVAKILKKCAGSRDKLAKSIGILSACTNGNKLTDYLPKGSDQKVGPAQGYTNFNGNVSAGPERPGMAPIPIDMFPGGHHFHRLRFKDGKPVLGYIYQVKSKNPGPLIGRVAWFYGFCDVLSGDKKQRRYGWVPALAVKRV